MRRMVTEATKRHKKQQPQKRHIRHKSKNLNLLCFLCLFVANTYVPLVALFVAQCFDWIERGGFAGGVVAEEDSYCRGEEN